MTLSDRWLLPEGIEELLPPAARRLEQLRRALLDLYDRWGYELVIPPLVEFIESLLIGTGHDLELQTCKLIDQVSGRLLGIRADMTPQVARIDAHPLQRSEPTRLCYLGTVLRTRGDSLGGSRSPCQAGVELYGHAGLESDLEVLSLMLETLAVAGLDNVHLDLGHVAIFRGLVRQTPLSLEQENALFAALQRKAVPEVVELLAATGLSDAQQALFRALAELNGTAEVLAAAGERLADGGDEVQQALADLRYLADALQRRWPALPVSFDLAELRGYRYHTGVVFAAYVPGHGQEVARGGRYDNIGQVFGGARPATGFSTDLHTLLALGPPAPPSPPAIYAPADDDPALEAYIQALRGRGQRVIRALPGAAGTAAVLGCDRVLVHRRDGWEVVLATA